MRPSPCSLLLLATVGLTWQLPAATWYNLTDSVAGANDWNGAFSWYPSAPPDAPGAVADFSTNNYTVTNEVFLNGSRTAGTVHFGDTTAPIVQTFLSQGSPAGGSLILDNNGAAVLIDTLASTSSPPLYNEILLPRPANEIRVPVVLAGNLNCIIRTAPATAAAARWAGVNFTGALTETGGARSITIDGNARAITAFSGSASHTGGTLVRTGSLYFGGPGSFGTGPITVLSPGQCAFASSRTVPNNLTIAGNGVPESAGDRGALFFPNGTVTLTGALALTAASRVEGTPAALVTLAGPLTGTTDLEFNALIIPDPNNPRTGDFILTGDASGFTGKLKVSRGGFTLGPVSRPGGAMDVSRSASLAGETTISGNLRLGTSSPDTTSATLLNVDPVTPGALHTAGNLDLTGPVRVRLTSLPPGPVVTLLTYGGALTGNPANLDLEGGLAAYRTGTAIDTASTPGAVLLNVVRGALTWTGGTATWDTAGPTWAGGETFHYLDDVTFDNTVPGGGVVTVSGNLKAGVMHVNNSAGNDFVIDCDSGPSASPAVNSIISGSLIKDGTGTLTIGINNGATRNRHTYNGGTVINAGSVIVYQNGAAALTNGPLGSGPLVMNGGALASASPLPISLYNPVTLNASVTLGQAGASGEFRLASRVVLGSSLTIHTPSSAGLGKGNDPTTGVTDNGTGRSLTKSGTGTLELASGSVSTLGGSAVVQQGELRVRGSLSAGAVSVSMGATLSGDGHITAPSVTIPAGATITGSNGSTNQFAVTLACTGSVTIGGTFAADIEQSVSDRLTVSGGLAIGGATLALHTVEPPRAAACILASYGSLSGTFASVTGLPYGYRLVYGYDDGTSSRNIALVAIPPYELWSAARGLTAGGNDAPSADPDKDGLTNLEHFAFDGDPLGTTGAPDGGKIRLELATAGGSDKYLTVTLPVRKGAVFTGTPAAAVVDGVRYEIRGSTALAAPWSLPVIEVTPARSAGLPALTTDTDTTPGPDCEYRTFRLQQPWSAQTRAFLTPVATAP